MKIRGQAFFDIQTFERVKFGLPEIDRVELQEAEITTVDVETNKVVGSQKIFLVIVLLAYGRLVSTKPLLDQDYAAYIAVTLADRCERFQKGS